MKDIFLYIDSPVNFVNGKYYFSDKCYQKTIDSIDSKLFKKTVFARLKYSNFSMQNESIKNIKINYNLIKGSTFKNFINYAFFVNKSLNRKKNPAIIYSDSIFLLLFLSFFLKKKLKGQMLFMRLEIIQYLIKNI